MMSRSTNAERQRRYRQRALRDPDGLLLTRLQVLISPPAAAALERIEARTGMTRRAIVERALIALEDALSNDWSMDHG